MSRYSGKCDVYDWFSEYTDEDIKKCKIYVGDECMPLRIDSRRDLMPYYPRLVVLGWGSGKTRSVRISTESFVDREEREQLEWKLEYAIKIYRRKKRKHEQFNPDKVIEETSLFNDKVYEEIVRRVAESGEKATIDGIKISYHEHNRKALYDDMVAAGYDARFARWWIWHDWKDYSEVKYAET